jgi:hypothetical protein
MPTSSTSVDPNYLTRRELAKFLTERGFPMSKSTLDKLAMPSRNEGPPHVGFWGNRALYDPERALAFLRTLRHLVEMIGSDVYGEFEAEARERLGQRDPDDWPILASALALRCPIWTEDSDFFGCGVATWTSNRVQVFLRK